MFNEIDLRISFKTAWARGLYVAIAAPLLLAALLIALPVVVAWSTVRVFAVTSAYSVLATCSLLLKIFQDNFGARE